MKIAFIVEGIKDAKQIYKAFEGTDSINNMKILITEGTKVNDKILKAIDDFVEQGYELYILSDPDEGGDLLAEMIQSYRKIKRIPVDRNKCCYFTGKKIKTGIEHSSYKYLRNLLNPYVKAE